MRPEVVAAMMPVFTEHFGNASSIHWFGQHAKSLIDDARQHVAKLINAEAGEIVFLSGGTEADNLAIRGIAESQKSKAGTSSARKSSIMRFSILAKISKSRDSKLRGCPYPATLWSIRRMFEALFGKTRS